MIGARMHSSRASGMPRPARFGPAAVALTAALAGCGNTKVERSTIPAQPTGGGSTTAAGALPATASGNFTGVDVPNRFGDVQVEITVARGRITAVTPVRLPSDRARSRFISAQAAPILRSEVLSTQSGQIDLVSGATYTSDSFAGSVQSALSQVH
jgi:uncharacterized protein with FMN-binding domain